jgi:acyl-CoA thioesterase
VLGSSGAGLWELLGVRRSGAGEWEVSIPRDWWAWSGPHGGVLGALATGAGCELGAGSVVRSIDLHYLERSDGQNLRFTSVLSRSGRGLQVVDVAATQEDRIILTGSITFVGASETDVPAVQFSNRPAVPPADQCARIPVPEQIVPIGAHLEIRPAGGALP